MSDFHFIRPEWFFALLPLIWMLWQLNRQKMGNHGWQQIIPQHLVKHLMQGQDATHHRPFWLLAVIWLLVVIALAGPAWEKLPQPVYQTNTGKVLVMDMSQSMLATDLTPNRLTKARFKAIDLIEKIDDADMGLIAYSGDAFVISPLTADSKNLTALIPSLSPNIMPLIGSNAYAALDLADGLLKNAGYSKGEIYWITDGIDQSELNDIRELLSISKHRVSILGVGTPQGAPIKQTSGELLKDGRGSIIIPKLNDSNLRTIAKATDGAYTRITSTAIDIETLAQQEIISREAKKEQDEQLHQGDQFREFGPIMVMLILPFAAYAFRRGLVFVFLLCSSGLLISTPTQVFAQNAAKPATTQNAPTPTPTPTPAAQAQAATPESTDNASSAPSWWTNMWQTQDQQAANHFDQQNYSDAAQMFDNNQWKGSSLYKSGDYEGALKEFQQSNDADGLYNQGNAHAQMQNFDEAIKAYEKALAQNPDMEDAKKNLELIKQMQQQQQQQQDQQNQDGENQDQQDQDQQQQNQDQQNQDQQGEGSEQEQQQQDQQGDQNQQQEQQNGQEGEQKGEQDDTQPREQEQQQGDQDPQAQQKEQPEEQSVPGEEREGEEGDEKGEQQVKPSEAQTTEEKEQMQEIQQLIRKINDDPSVLLRNKMQLEYQKRKHQNSSPPGAKSW